jgi:hypothetical protein
MPLTIINSFASWVLKQRIHQIELFLKYPNEVQEELLMNLIQSSRTLLLGKEYDYASIIPMQHLQNSIYYEELQPLIERTRTGEQNVLGHSHKMVCQICGTTNAK